MKIRLIVLAFVCLLCGFAFAQEDQVTPTPTFTPTPLGSYVVRADIYVRGGPGERFLPVGRLVAGNVVEPLSRNAAATWVLIAYGRGFGWIRRDLAYWAVDLNALPVIDETNLTPTTLPGSEIPTSFFVTPTLTGNWVNVGPQGAFIRVGPGEQYATLGELQDGDGVEPVGRDADTEWILIRFNDGFAWISRRLVHWVDDLGRLPVLRPGALTPTATFTGTLTPTETPTSSLTPSNTTTPAPSVTPAPTDTPTVTPTETAVPTNTPTDTSSPTDTPTETATNTETATDTPVPSDTPTPIPPTATNTPVPSLTPTETSSPSATFTLLPSATSVPSDTPTETPAPTNTPTPQPTLTNTLEPSNTPTETTVPTDTATEVFTPTLTDTPLPSDTPTEVPTNTSTNTVVPPTATNTQTSTLAPSNTATYTITPTDSPIPPSATPAVVAAVGTETPNLELTATRIALETAVAVGQATVNAMQTAAAAQTEAISVLPSDTMTHVPTNTITPSVSPVPEMIGVAAPTGESVPPTGTSGGGRLPVELIVGGVALLLLLGYVGLYWRGLASLERYANGFVIEQCPVCGRGQLMVETRHDRVLGIPRGRTTVRCSVCRSVLREAGNRHWRYAVDRLENPALYERLNGKVVDEATLKSLSSQPRPPRPPRPRPPTRPPKFEDEE